MDGNSDIAGLLEGLDPDVLQKLMDLGVVDDEQAQQMLKMQDAQSKRATPTPQGMEVGGTYIAANPLQHMATAIRQWQGEKGIKDVYTGLEDLTGKKRTGLAEIIRLWKGRGAQPVPDESTSYGYGY